MYIVLQRREGSIFRGSVVMTDTLPFSELPYGYAAVQDALLHIRSGQEIVYYCGFLADDKKNRIHSGNIEVIAQLAYALYSKGKVDLLQRKVRCIDPRIPEEVQCYEYLARGR